MNQFAGTISAYGGGGANWGGAGTVYTQTNGQSGQIIVDNDGRSSATTPIQSGSSSTGLILRNGAVGSANTYTTLGNVLVSSNAWLLVTNIPTLTMSSATIEAGGGIIADSAGYAAGQGNGAGHYYGNSPTYPCSGAGHGGNGGFSLGYFAVGGVAYDSQMSPSLLGSGGGTYSTYSVGGAGGGAFHLTVTGLLQVDGAISANGGNGCRNRWRRRVRRKYLAHGRHAVRRRLDYSQWRGRSRLGRRWRSRRLYRHLSHSEPVCRSDFRLWRRRLPIGAVRERYISRPRDRPSNSFWTTADNPAPVRQSNLSPLPSL